MVRSLKRINVFYKSLILIFINRFVRDGIRVHLYKIFIKILIRLKKRFFKPFFKLLTELVAIFSPLVQLRPKFASGIVYMIPDYVRHNKALVLGLHFFVKAIKNRRESKLYFKILYEIRDVLKHRGLTLKYKKEFYDLTIANRHLLFKFSKRKK